MCLQRKMTVEDQNQIFYAMSMFDTLEAFERELPKYMDTAFTFNSLFNEFCELSEEEKKERCLRSKMKVDMSHTEADYMTSTENLKTYYEQLKEFKEIVIDAERNRYGFTYYSHQEYYAYKFKSKTPKGTRGKKMMSALSKEQDTFNELTYLSVPTVVRIKNHSTSECRDMDINFFVRAFSQEAENFIEYQRNIGYFEKLLE